MTPSTLSIVSPKPKHRDSTIEEGETCIHHWLIEPPDGRLSVGVCKYCGRVRTFLNNWIGDTGK